MAQHETQSSKTEVAPEPQACAPVDDTPTVIQELCGIPPDLLERALDNPDAIQVAMEIGRLDVISILITVLGIFLGVTALVGSWMIRREALAVAQEAAVNATPSAVSAFMDGSGDDIVRQSLKHPVVVARLQAEFIRLGIEDADSAADVDTDADRKETEDGESDG